MRLHHTSSGETRDILDSFETPLEPPNNYVALKFGIFAPYQLICITNTNLDIGPYSSFQPANIIRARKAYFKHAVCNFTKDWNDRISGPKSLLHLEGMFYKNLDLCSFSENILLEKNIQVETVRSFTE